MTTNSISRKPSSQVYPYLQRHPLASFFILAYLLTWLVAIPVVISQTGLGIIPVHLPYAPVITLGALVGPAFAAWFVTYVCEGKEGLKRLAQAMVKWKVSPLWYLIVLFGFPLVFLTGISIFIGVDSFSSVIHNPSLLALPYGSTLLFNILQTTLWEEPGWRGFALPRLQIKLGPMRGSLLLGLAWAFWHLPAYFVVGWMGPFNLPGFIVNILLTVVLSVIFTWVYNGTGSVLMTMLLHASSNATNVYIARLFPDMPPQAALGIIGALIITSVLICLLTRFRLRYPTVSGGAMTI
jgi:membrane protease YdiL (CAAX protease family)